MKRRITKHGEEVLKKPSMPIDYAAFKDELPALLKDMWETMRRANGVGLAAPQIGLNHRIAVIDVKPEGRSQRFVLINPEIISREGDIIEEEGCLSVPGLYAKVKRHRKVRLRALDENGESWEHTGTGLLARAFEHEVDHLDGRLFLHHLSVAERLKIAPVLQNLKKDWD
jgi:peptide deformylase